MALLRPIAVIVLLAGSLLPAAASAQVQPITPGTPRYKNVESAIKLLREHGEEQAANEIQKALETGNISVNPKIGGNGETGPGEPNVEIAPTMVDQRKLALLDKPFNEDDNFQQIFELARTLYHENIHSNHQSFVYDVVNRKSGVERDAWTKTISAMERWIERERQSNYDAHYRPLRPSMTAAEHQRELKRIQAKMRVVREYLGDYAGNPNNYFGHDGSRHASPFGVNLMGLDDRPWVKSTIQYWQKEEETYITPQLPRRPDPEDEPASVPPAATTPVTPRAPDAPAPEPSSRPIPCTQCQGIAANIAALREKGKQVEQAYQAAKDQRDQADRRLTDLQRKAEGINRELQRSAGTGGSSYDPTTGQTIDSHDQGDGTVKITTKDANGNVIDERFRDASARKAERAKELEETNAEIEQAKYEAGKAAEAANNAYIEEMNLMDQMDRLTHDLQDCIEKYCRTASSADTLNMIGLPYPALDGLANAYAFNPFGGDTNGIYQTMMIEIRAGDTDGISVPGNRGAPSRGALEDLRQPKTLLAAFWSLIRPPARFASMSRGFMIETTSRSRERWEEQRNAAARPSSPVQMLLTSLGQSTGQAFDLQIFNSGHRPFRLSADALVVEPLKDEVKKQVQAGLQRLMSSVTRPVTAKLDGYCLEFLKLPPTAGTIFKIASPELQQRFAPLRNIMTASRKLQEAGQLHPDSDPNNYFHSIRQWAMWTLQEKFTDKTFGNAFVEHTKKALAAQKRPWNGEIEKVVRGAIPNRWLDVQRILTAARD